MPLRVGIVSAAHMHASGYAHALENHPDAELSLVWDDITARGEGFASAHGVPFQKDLNALFDAVDAVIITSENLRHIDHLEAAHAAGKPALCEKPIVSDADAANRLEKLIEAHAKIMTAFPCRYSPAYLRLKQRVQAGDIGAIRAICATNHGRCPFGWFVETELSGGGAMIDHVVHVADLLLQLKAQDVKSVQAQTGNNMYGQAWEDTAMLTLEFADGSFATIDSSWSRPSNYKIWGDVTMNVVGDGGVIEIDMFGQQFDTYRVDPGKFASAFYGSDLDAALVADFVKFASGAIPAPITALDGLKAAQIALAGYASAAASQTTALA